MTAVQLRGVGSLGGEREEVKREVKRREEYIGEKEREGVVKLRKKEASEGWRKDK